MIPYALKNGEPVSIAKARRGLACGCVCPACGNRVMAKKGAARVHHFSHYKMEECPHALESSLHLAAKAILLRSGKIRLPALELHGFERLLCHEKDWPFDQVVLEKRHGQVIPDIALIKGQRKILVEAAVTHAVGPAKLHRLRQLNLPVLEIDVAAIHLELTGLGLAGDPRAFARKLVEETRHKKWLFHPWQQAVEYRIRQAALRKKVRINARYRRFTVDGCPLKKRILRSGPMAGTAYADLWQDCYFCPFCFEIEYRNKQVGYRELQDRPDAVICRANLGTEEEVLKGL
ncbi:MAG: hypothetical protein H6562_04940 [Lewinellaceae bacterium]|nr:hypothetical protein [Lewinellaceae bacterium]